MIRTALRPRWLAWFAVSIAALYVCIRLGLWQLDVARASGAEDAQRELESKPTAPLSSIVEPHAPWDGRVMANRKVTMTGRYDPSGQFLVPNRLLEGRTGYWVVTPFRTTQPAGVIATVRGWTPTATAPAPPTGERTLTGTLAQGESPADGTVALPPGQEGTIDLARLVNEWHGDLYNAFAFVASEQPPAETAGLTRVPPPRPESGMTMRNAAYAVQWWVFGAFCPLLWWRMVRSAHEEERRAAAAGPAGPDGPDPDADADAGPGATVRVPDARPDTRDDEGEDPHGTH